MRILLLNQTFHPDIVATAQYLTQLALGLIEKGHAVTVVSSRRGYDAQEQLFPKHETWRGIEIYRISSSSFGKSTQWRRAIDFGTFMLNCAWRVLTLPHHDVVVTLTSPPLISFLGALLTLVRRSHLIYWVMDLNPDEAVAAGWLRQDSWAAHGLEAISRFSLRRASRIVVLDRFTKERIRAKGIPAGKVVVIPVWSHDDAVRFDAKGRELFRLEHGLADKFVVMYSGNHSPCHPLETLLEAAKALAGDSRIAFLFVGGGSGFAGVKAYARAHGLSNVQCLPYQPIERLSASLSAADMHVVVMGDPFVGIIHPCKIYNILAVLTKDQGPGTKDQGPGTILYIGPEVSHVTEILGPLGAAVSWGWARHGDVEAVRRCVEAMAAGTGGAEQSAARCSGCAPTFARDKLLGRMIDEITSSPC
jgi:colanic acid biosynthesis glycosyl transferase WcaI